MTFASLFLCTRNIPTICTQKPHFVKKKKKKNKQKIFPRFENCVSIENFWEKHCSHNNSVWSIYQHTGPNNLWAKSTIFGSTERPFSRQYDGFDAPYPSNFGVSAISLGMLRNLIWAGAGAESGSWTLQQQNLPVGEMAFLVVHVQRGCVPSSQTLQWNFWRDELSCPVGRSSWEETVTVCCHNWWYIHCQCFQRRKCTVRHEYNINQGYI